jgi:hypothetical protein
MLEPFFKTNDFLVGHSKLVQLGYPFKLTTKQGFLQVVLVLFLLVLKVPTIH